MAAVSLAKGTCTLWQEEVLVDYTIEVGDERFRVHKVVMAAVSDYFKAMLTGGMVESQADRVRLHELSSDAVLNMIEYIYTGQFGANKSSTEELLGCAVYLQIPAAIEECTKLLIRRVNCQNCFDILATFRTYSVKDGVENVTQYIKSNIDDLMEDCPLEMSLNAFQCYMDFWKKSEWELFVCVLEWVGAQGNQSQHLNTLMSHVRFAIMTPGQLAAIKQIDVYTKSDCAWRELVTAAEAFQNLPTHRKVLDESEQSRVRSDPIPVCYTADEVSSSVFFSLYNGKFWKKHEAQFAPTLYEGVAAHITVNNYLIVCDSHYSRQDHESLIQGWHIFNPRTSAWSSMAAMNVARDEFAVVHHKKHLYALGGYTSSLDNPATNVIERYDLKTNNWEVISTKLPVCLHGHSACVISDLIYVTGGFTDGIRYAPDFSKRLDSLDMSTNTWESRAPSPIDKYVSAPVDAVQVMKLWGEEVLFIFKRTFEMQYYSPSADQWYMLDCLSHMDSNIVHSYCPYVIADGNTLFLHSFVGSMKQNSTDNSYRHVKMVCAKPGERIACVKWTFGKKGEKISEIKLKDFPVDINGEIECDFFTALLSIPPQHLRRPKKLSAGRRSPKK